MNICQVSSTKNLNQAINNKYNNPYYKTEPMANDSVSFKGLMSVPRWEIPRANTGLKKLLFGTGLSAAAIFAIEKQFSFVPALENEIQRPDLKSINSMDLSRKEGFEVLPNESGYKRGNLIVTAINPNTLQNESANLDEKTLQDAHKAYLKCTAHTPLLESSAMMYLDLYKFNHSYKTIATIKDIESNEIVLVQEANPNTGDIYIPLSVKEKYSMKIKNPQNKTETGILTIDKNSDYATKVQDFNLEKEVQVIYPDGTEKNLKDLYLTQKDAINFLDNSGVTVFNMYKDKNGVLYSDNCAGWDGNYAKITENNAKKKYYALSDDLEYYSIDINKLPKEQAFEFYATRPKIRKVFEIPYGTVLKCGDETIQASNKKRNFLYVDYKGNYRMTDKIDRSCDAIFCKPIDNQSKEKWDSIFETGKNEVEEMKFNEKYKAVQQKYSADNTTRNIKALEVTGSVPFVTTRECKPTNFYKQVYDYYVNKYPEYKNYQFVFTSSAAYGLSLEIKNGDKIVDTCWTKSEIVDGPVFEKSREIIQLGEYKTIIPYN